MICFNRCGTEWAQVKQRPPALRSCEAASAFILLRTARAVLPRTSRRSPGGLVPLCETRCNSVHQYATAECDMMFVPLPANPFRSGTGADDALRAFWVAACPPEEGPLRPCQIASGAFRRRKVFNGVRAFDIVRCNDFGLERAICGFRGFAGSLQNFYWMLCFAGRLVQM